MLALSDVIDPAKLSGSKVVFGATVKLTDTDSGDEVVYSIVGEQEADIKKGLISITRAGGARAHRPRGRRHGHGAHAQGAARVRDPRGLVQRAAVGVILAACGVWGAGLRMGRGIERVVTRRGDSIEQPPTEAEHPQRRSPRRRFSPCGMLCATRSRCVVAAAAGCRPVRCSTATGEDARRRDVDAERVGRRSRMRSAVTFDVDAGGSIGYRRQFRGKEVAMARRGDRGRAAVRRLELYRHCRQAGRGLELTVTETPLAPGAWPSLERPRCLGDVDERLTCGRGSSTKPSAGASTCPASYSKRDRWHGEVFEPHR